MDLGVWGKHGKSARELEQSPMAMVCHLPTGRQLGMGQKKSRDPLMANTWVYLVLRQWMEEVGEK